MTTTDTTALDSGDPHVRFYADLENASMGVVSGLITFGVAPLSRTRPHEHQSEETWIVRAGAGHALVAGQRIPLEVGARVVVPGGAPHHIVNEGTEELRVLSFWWRPSA